jgi:uncharacterized protein involved in exopolysaccharide biosynthesis
MLTARKNHDLSRPELDDTDRLIQGVFEPPSGFVLSAIARNKWIVAVFAVLLALAGTCYGLSRPRTFTASATLQIGQVNPNSPGFYGYVQSAASLATAFSRAIEAEPVLNAVQQRLRLSPSQASRRLSAEPIPTSPAMRVIATGPTDLAAMQLANVAAGALISYENQSNSTNPEAASLLHEYQAASLALRRTEADVAQRNRQGRGFSNALAMAESEQKAAQVKVQALGVAYTSAIASRAPSSGLVSLVAGAAAASNDHSANTQKFGFIGLLLGIVIGCLTAMLIERRRMTRPLARGVEDETQTV